MKYFMTFFLVFFPSVVFGGVQFTASCPSQNKLSDVSFEYKSTVNIIAATNKNSIQLPETPSGVFVPVSLSGTSDASKQISVVMSSGSYQNVSCSDGVPENTFVLPYQYIFFFGVALAIAFIKGAKN